MKTKKAAAIPFKSTEKDILTEEELISMDPQFKYLTPEKRVEAIEFVYELGLVLYNYANASNLKDDEVYQNRS